MSQEVRKVQDILRQLFFGNYNPFEILSERDGSEKSDRGDITKQLQELVQPEQFSLIEKLLGDIYESQTKDMVRAFKVGVRFGARFVIAACLDADYQEDEVTEDG